ncbi:MAG: CDP-alcohol phosphatidyltransferase family protein [Gammaproteobacteria bacterium]|nr:MAG: CDP-alcohol phosphatidyltransferase family protein [Gammaproteobacteria bacterium]
MKRSDLPNILTAFRFLLVPLVVVYMLDHSFGPALVLFALAGISDALDGFLARRYQWTSRVGALMDPLADKLLMVSSFLALGWLGLLPYWLVGLVILRDLVIVTGAIIYNARIEKVEADPSVVSKLNTLAQILLVLSVMFSHAIYALPLLWIDALIYSVLVTIVWSGIGYVWTWGRRAWLKRAH